MTTSPAIRSALLLPALILTSLAPAALASAAPTQDVAPPVSLPGAAKPGADDGIRVGDAIDPAAAAILDRASAVLLAMRSFEATTETKGKAFVEEVPPGTDVGPARVTLRFRSQDGVAMPHMRVDTLGAGREAEPTRMGAFDGKASISIDVPARQYNAARGFGALTLAEFSALPRWAIETRTKAALKAAKREGGVVMSKRVAARVVGTELVDGEECDVVATTLVLDAFMSDPSSASDSMNERKPVRMIETIAFARKDGLPRRIVTASENPGEGPYGAVELTTTYSQVRFDASIDDAVFAPKPPEGFVLARPAPPGVPTQPMVVEPASEVPTQAPPPQPPAAPTPPASPK